MGDGVVPHGIGVVYGMLSSSYAAEKLGIMSVGARREHDELCWLLTKRWEFPEPKPSVEKIMSLAMRDSKRGLTSEAEDEISDVLLTSMGDVVQTKRSLVVAFGGGALMNVTGLFASMLYRGSKLIYVPTTLLAMHDVVTSLKTSICFDGRKNNIGTFYAPLKILIDVAFCRTLSR